MYPTRPLNHTQCAYKNNTDETIPKFHMINKRTKPTVDLEMRPEDRLRVEKFMSVLFGDDTPHRAIYRIVFLLVACPIVFVMSIYRLLRGALMVVQGLFGLLYLIAIGALFIGGALFLLRELVRFLLS